ncbi:MAG: hypothetical protein RLZZ01_611, partial [Actinomycetota bacterium]
MNSRAVRFSASLAVLAVASSVVVVGGASTDSVLAVGPELTVESLTWDVIGLDSNDETDGPNVFPLGQRVCNVGDAPATGVEATLVWDGDNAFIDVLPGTASTITLGDVDAGVCAEAYFNIEIQRDDAAYDTVRPYHVEVTGGGVTAESTRPREFYVEYLVSQNRNATNSISLDGTEIPAGGTRGVVPGGTYEIVLDASTATQGYNNLETFLHLDNSVFRVLSVESTYTADSSPFVPDPNDRLYADACGWDPDPTSPNYLSCVGGDGKAGGDIIVTYTVQIVGGSGTVIPLNPMLYDFSGSSFHYNSDFDSAVVYLAIGAPSDVPFAKSFEPKSIRAGEISTLEFVVENPFSAELDGVGFVDEFPAGMTVADPPSLDATGCGDGAFDPVPVAGDGSVSFGGGAIGAQGTCRVSIDVTVDADGTYENVSESLRINGSTDTGLVAADDLVAKTPTDCTPDVTLANWTVPSTSTNPPDTVGGSPTVQSGLVPTAVASLKLPGSSTLNTSTGSGDTSSWEVWGFKNDGQFIEFEVDTTNFSDVALSFAVRNGDGAGPSSFD